MNNFWSYRAPAIAWALFLFTLSSIPDIPSPIHLGSWDDKLNHFIAYGILGALVLRATTMNRELPNGRHFKLTLSLAVLFGATDELHQYFVPGRFMEFYDFVADAAGIAAGALFYLWLCKRRSPNKSLGT
jgi:VanZ family protein